MNKKTKAAKISVFAALFLSVLKIIFGFVTGSGALIADALHNVADLFARFSGWLGLKIAEREPTEKFPYGYYKTENIAALFVSLLIVYASVELLINGYFRIFAPPAKLFLPLAGLAVSLVSLIVSFLVARYQKKTGKKINSQNIIANSRESLLDALSSFIVFIAILANMFNIYYVEGVIIVVISLFIFRFSVINIRNSVFSLMDASPSKDIEGKVKKVLSGLPEIQEFEGLKLRKSGPFIFGECTIRLKKSIDAEKAHKIADEIEERIKEGAREIESFALNIEPCKPKRQRIVLPVKSRVV